MSGEYFCSTCEKFFQLDDLTMVVDWNGYAEASRAIFRDNKSGLTHLLMTEKRSAWKKAKLSQSKPASQVTVVKEEVPAAPAQQGNP